MDESEPRSIKEGKIMNVTAVDNVKEVAHISGNEENREVIPSVWTMEHIPSIDVDNGSI